MSVFTTVPAATETLAALGTIGLAPGLAGLDAALTAGSDPGHTHTLAAGATDVTSTAAELNILDGVTSNATELNVLDGIPGTLTATELGYVDGVTSAIQGQIDAKSPIASPTFTGTVTIPTPFTIGAVSMTATGTELNLLDGLTAVSGSDTVIITGTAGTASDLAIWNGDGDLVDGPTPPSGTIVGTTDTQTLTNKRLTPRVTTISSSATPTVNTDNCDAVTITALATAITSMTTNLSGTPNNFDKLIYRILDDGTGRAITWGASFQAMGASLPTTTTASKVLTVGFIYDSVDSKWGCVASVEEA